MKDYFKSSNKYMEFIYNRFKDKNLDNDTIKKYKDILYSLQYDISNKSNDSSIKKHIKNYNEILELKKFLKIESYLCLRIEGWKQILRI